MNEGWICPKCNHGVAPGVERCPCQNAAPLLSPNWPNANPPEPAVWKRWTLVDYVPTGCSACAYGKRPCGCVAFSQTIC